MQEKPSVPSKTEKATGSISGWRAIFSRAAGHVTTPRPVERRVIEGYTTDVPYSELLPAPTGPGLGVPLPDDLLRREAPLGDDGQNDSPAPVCPTCGRPVPSRGV